MELITSNKDSEILCYDEFLTRSYKPNEKSVVVILSHVVKLDSSMSPPVVPQQTEFDCRGSLFEKQQMVTSSLRSIPGGSCHAEQITGVLSHGMRLQPRSYTILVVIV